MFVGVVFVFASALTSVYGTCQSLDGKSVPWWILYQQKERPFFHQYVDSTNSHRIKDHYPEMADSVLSRVMSSLIDDTEAEYIIYSSDLMNVKDIAGKTSIPTYSKWMHGILGTTSSWDSGFWILHNNLLFPAITKGALSVPGSKAWYATTVGDSSADLFYVCLTAENKGNMTEMLISIMAGNPFIYKKKLQNYNFLQPYLKDVQPLHTSFGYEMSATIFLNCMHASSINVSTNCLFTYGVTTGVGIHIFTRPRGMLKHSSAFCYDDQSLSVFDFLKLGKSSTLKSGFPHSMFALSDKSGTTCFGQDVAANAETVAVMICATLPRVHSSMIKSARLTQWSCSQDKGQMRPNTDNLKFPINTQTSISNPSMGNNGENNIETLANNANINDEKNEAKFCQMYNCDINDDTNNNQELLDNPPLKNPLLKNQKIAAWFSEMVTDIRMHQLMENPQKKLKTANQEKKAINVKGSLEINQFLLKNEKAILALFCREGCRFCQNAKEQIVLLTKIIQTDYFDVAIVDIQEPLLPEYLRVPFTPFLRYKFPGSTEWVDFSGKKYDIGHFLTFLHDTITTSARRSISVDNGKSNAKKDVHDLDNSKIARRKRSAYKQSTRLEYNNGAKLRIKRDIDNYFTNSHIWEYNGDPTTVTEKQVEEKFYPLKKPVNTFITTRNKKETLYAIQQITNDYFKKDKYENVTFNYKTNFKFNSFTLRDINATVIHATKRKGEKFSCSYAIAGAIVVTAYPKKNLNGVVDNFSIYHLNTNPIKDNFVLTACKKDTPNYNKEDKCPT